MGTTGDGWTANTRIGAVAEAIRRKYGEVEVRVGYPEGRVDLMLNATAAGWRAGDALPWDLSAFELRQAAAVDDMIYRPTRTPLLLRAALKANVYGD